MPHPRPRHRVLACLLPLGLTLFGWFAILVLIGFVAGCGGGSSQATPIAAPSPTPSADFSLSLSSSAVSVAQGATSSPIIIAVNPKNSFAGSVQISLTGLPTNVVANPAGPFAIPAGSAATVLFGATTQAASGNFTINAQATSGSLSHSASLDLTIQPSAAALLPRTTFVRTDSTPSADNPLGEASHRHMAYDSTNHHLFVANRAMNRVEIFSTSDQSRATPPMIDVPGASSADISPDGATIWIGTITEQIVAIDTATLQIRQRYRIQPLSTAPNETYGRPEEVIALSSGTCLVRLRESDGPDAILALWNPATNAIATAPDAEDYGFGAIGRTADHSDAIIATNDPTNDLAVFNSSGNVTAGPISLGSSPGATPVAAANSDGSRFAVLFTSGNVSQIILLDAALNQIATASGSATGLAFSPDGSVLYVSGASPTVSAIQVFDGHTLALLGQVPDPAIQSVASQIEIADENQLLFAIANRGVTFIDAAAPSNLPSIAPAFAAAPVAQPAAGPAAGGTNTALLGENFEATAQIAFAHQLATNTNVAGATLLQTTSPPNAVSGAANITAFFPSGWLALAPDAFSYGPQILTILPNAGNKSGNDTIQIYGYGFGSDPGSLSVTIGASNASV